MSWFLDGLAVFFMVYLGVVGFKRGFIEELGRLIGLLLAVVIAISNSTSLFIQLNGIINVDEWIGIFLSFSLLFSATLIAARVLTKLVHIAMLSKSNQLMNYSLGFLFGTMKGFFVIIIFVILGRRLGHDERFSRLNYSYCWYVFSHFFQPSF